MEIKWHKRAIRQLRKISDRTIQTRIREAVKRELPDWRNSQNVKALTNHQYPYRLRVGNWRVFFAPDHGGRILWIEEVKKRDEHTY